MGFLSTKRSFESNFYTIQFPRIFTLQVGFLPISKLMTKYDKYWFFMAIKYVLLVFWLGMFEFNVKHVPYINDVFIGLYLLLDNMKTLGLEVWFEWSSYWPFSLSLISNQSCRWLEDLVLLMLLSTSLCCWIIVVYWT